MKTPQSCAPASAEIAADDRPVYQERAALLAFLTGHHPACIVHGDPSQPGMALLYVHTPQGQMSWHLHSEDLVLFPHVPRMTYPDGPLWDGHSTTQKYRRLDRLVRKCTPLGAAPDDLDAADVQAGQFLFIKKEDRVQVLEVREGGALLKVRRLRDHGIRFAHRRGDRWHYL
ncbi:hypothetical protein OHA25_60455 (plasmid) [Nonomuraea sp. NBC_00507]|uniref:WDGH domain-containing protein n=1 Tax=Nonomuraea sp. NBC_00507 TaxID=2976002 RepID=UPI002E186BDE